MDGDPSDSFALFNPYLNFNPVPMRNEGTEIGDNCTVELPFLVPPAPQVLHSIATDAISIITDLEDRDEAKTLLIEFGQGVPVLDYARILGLDTNTLCRMDPTKLTIENICDLYFTVHKPAETYALNSELQLHVSSDSNNGDTFEVVDVSPSKSTQFPTKTLSPTPEDLALLNNY